MTGQADVRDSFISRAKVAGGSHDRWNANKGRAHNSDLGRDRLPRHPLGQNSRAFGCRYADPGHLCRSRCGMARDKRRHQRGGGRFRSSNPRRRLRPEKRKPRRKLRGRRPSLPTFVKRARPRKPDTGQRSPSRRPLSPNFVRRVKPKRPPTRQKLPSKLPLSPMLKPRAEAALADANAKIATANSVYAQRKAKAEAEIAEAQARGMRQGLEIQDGINSCEKKCKGKIGRVLCWL